MAGLHRIWVWIVAHETDLAIAAVFALLFAVFVELVGIGSLIRNGVRHLKNKLSERSAKLLRRRIKQLEIQRGGIAAYLGSDKALYLATFRIVIGILIAIAMGLAFTALGDILRIYPPITIVSFICYLLAVVGGGYGFSISRLDTRAKVTAMIEKLEGEIADLKEKLACLT
jgi:hypothetical protein